MKIFSLVLALLVVASPSYAREKWDFGRIDYGAEIRKEPAGVTGWACDPDGGCTFTDDMAVKYTTWEGRVVIKTIVVGTSDKPLPFNIDASVDRQAILTRISEKTGLTFDCETHATNPNIDADVTFCSAAVIRGEPGVWLDLRFARDGGLQEIEIFTHYI